MPVYEQHNLDWGYPPLSIMYNIPMINAYHGPIPDVFVPFHNYVAWINEPKKYWVHFFIDDYRFERVWNQPLRYARILKRFAGAVAPDFSFLVDLPFPLQLYNLYRRAWCAWFWQRAGIPVIWAPTWGGRETWSYSFSGGAFGGVVMISTVGVRLYEEDMETFMAGYREMLRRLRPETVLVLVRKTKVPLPGNVVYYHYDRPGAEAKRMD